MVLGLSICQLGVMFDIGFVCLWVGKYVIMPFKSRDGVSVGLFLLKILTNPMDFKLKMG